MGITMVTYGEQCDKTPPSVWLVFIQVTEVVEKVVASIFAFIS